MKTNPFTKDRVEIMQAQGIPEDKRKEYTKYLEETWSWIGGYASKVDAAIDHIQPRNIRGTEAVDYIDKQIQRQNDHLEEGLVESFALNWF